MSAPVTAHTSDALALQGTWRQVAFEGDGVREPDDAASFSAFGTVMDGMPPV